MNNKKIIAMIPARIGSTRLKMKNLALLNDKPLIYYSIKAAKESKMFQEIILNSDDEIFKKIADRYSIKFYHRPEELGSSSTKSDHVVLNFIEHYPCDIIVWVNPIAPLQTGSQIEKIIQYFVDNKLDTLFTVKKEQVHCTYNSKPLNYSTNEIFAKTQDLEPVFSFVYSIMMWRVAPFIKNMKQKDYAFFTGNVGYYPVDKISSVIIKYQEDLLLAETLMKLKSENENYHVKYDDIAKSKD